MIQCNTLLGFVSLIFGYYKLVAFALFQLRYKLGSKIESVFLTATTH